MGDSDVEGGRKGREGSSNEPGIKNLCTFIWIKQNLNKKKKRLSTIITVWNTVTIIGTLLLPVVYIINAKLLIIKYYQSSHNNKYCVTKQILSYNDYVHNYITLQLHYILYYLSPQGAVLFWPVKERNSHEW